MEKSLATIFTCPGCPYYFRTTGACMYEGPHGCVNAYPKQRTAKQGKITVKLPDHVPCSITHCDYNLRNSCTLAPGQYAPDMRC